MRRGTRRGQSTADGLRIFIRGDDAQDIPSPHSSPDTPTSSTSKPSAKTKVESPSPTTTSFPTVTKSDSPSPTTTTFATSITSTAAPFLNHPELSSTTSLIPTSVTVSQTTSSNWTPTTTKPAATTTAVALAPAIISTSASSPTPARAVKPDTTTSSSTLAESTATTTDGLGPFLGPHDDSGKLHLDAGAVAGIAIGTSAGTILIAALLFFLYRKWNKGRGKDDSEAKSNPGPGPSSSSSVRQYLPRRFTHRSDDRIMNELMEAAYSAESGDRNSYQDKMPVNVNGYLMEKKQQQRSLRENNDGDDGDDDGGSSNGMPIMLPEPAAQPGFKRTKRISRWLGRHDDGEMLNPMSARASLVSSATGLRPLTMRSMSGWGSDDGYSEYTRTTEPPSRLRPPPQQKQQGEPDPPAPLELGGEDADAEELDAQGIDVRVRDSTPIAQFPSPEQLNLPPPPGRPQSTTARTEVTGRSSGTWNTWGVSQHRDQPKGWKEKLGM